MRSFHQVPLTLIALSFTIAVALDLVHISSVQAAPLVQTQVFVGAGDIADCRDSESEAAGLATASLLDNIEGTIFTLGDNVYSTDSNRFSECYQNSWGTHKERTKPAVGNWEYNRAPKDAADYYAYFQGAASPMEPSCTSDCKGYYSYDLGDWHIVVLNSEMLVNDSGSTFFDSTDIDAQLAWLEADLAANQHTCILAYWHHPRFSSGGSDNEVSPFWNQLWANGADVILNGHRHMYEHLSPRWPDGSLNSLTGIRQFVVGTGGADLISPGGQEPGTIARNNSTYGVMKLTLQPDAYEWEFIPIEGQTFTDSGSTTCTGSAGPSVTISSTSPNPTSATSIAVTVQFNVNVIGFAAGDIAVSNGTVSNFQTEDANTYTFDLIPNAPGTVTVNVGAGAAQDATTNPNTAAAPFSIVFDNVAPSVAINSSSPDPTSDSPISVAVQFNENVTGFDQTDVQVAGGTISNFAGTGASYTFNITPAAPGEVTVNIPASVAQDAAGNLNTAAAPFARTYFVVDTTGPTVTISSTAPNPTTVSPISITVQFSEDVNGFSAADVAVTNGTVSNLKAIDANTYIVTLTLSAPGEVTVNIPAGVAQDAAGNDNQAAAPFAITYVVPDTSGPSVTINQASGQADPTTTSPIRFTVLFNEPVNGFTNSDVTLGGTAGATTAVVTQVAPNNGTTYEVAVSGMTGSGTVTASIAAGAVTDAAGNPNQASTSTDNTVTFTVEEPEPNLRLMLPLVKGKQ